MATVQVCVQLITLYHVTHLQYYEVTLRVCTHPYSLGRMKFLSIHKRIQNLKTMKGSV